MTKRISVPQPNTKEEALYAVRLLIGLAFIDTGEHGPIMTEPGRDLVSSIALKLIKEHDLPTIQELSVSMADAIDILDALFKIADRPGGQT